MIMVFGAFSISIFGFIMLFACAFTVLLAIFSLIYLSPFYFWLGAKKADQLYLDLNPQTLREKLRCATILYKSLLNHKKPVF